jgi:hypothetical protein
MCGGGGRAPDNSAQIAAQEQSLRLQQEQMAMQQEQMAAQKAQYQEQLAISKAAPPPAPNRGAMAAIGALEMPTAQAGAAPTDTAAVATAQAARAGMGRRKFRTDLAPVTTLGIPGVG